jgi:hypothetical protein
MTRQPSLRDPEADDHLMAMLRGIRDRDAAAEDVDSVTLARHLGWTAAMTAATVAAAQSRLLIWGIRVGGTPAPCLEEIELTVQGRRLLSAADG